MIFSKDKWFLIMDEHILWIWKKTCRAGTILLSILTSIFTALIVNYIANFLRNVKSLEDFCFFFMMFVSSITIVYIIVGLYTHLLKSEKLLEKIADGCCN